MSEELHDEVEVEFAMDQRVYKTYRLPRPDWWRADMVQAHDAEYTERLYEHAQEHGIFLHDEFGELATEPDYNIIWTSDEKDEDDDS